MLIIPFHHLVAFDADFTGLSLGHGVLGIRIHQPDIRVGQRQPDTAQFFLGVFGIGGSSRYADLQGGMVHAFEFRVFHEQMIEGRHIVR